MVSSDDEAALLTAASVLTLTGGTLTASCQGNGCAVPSSSLLIFTPAGDGFALVAEGVDVVDGVGHDSTTFLLSGGDSGSCSDFAFFAGGVLVLGRAGGAPSRCSHFTLTMIGERLCRDSTMPLCNAASHVMHSTAAHGSHCTDPDKAEHSSHRAMDGGVTENGAKLLGCRLAALWQDGITFLKCSVQSFAVPFHVRGSITSGRTPSMRCCTRRWAPRLCHPRHRRASLPRLDQRKTACSALSLKSARRAVRCVASIDGISDCVMLLNSIHYVRVEKDVQTVVMLEYDLLTSALTGELVPYQQETKTPPVPHTHLFMDDREVDAVSSTTVAITNSQINNNSTLRE